MLNFSIYHILRRILSFLYAGESTKTSRECVWSH